MIDAMSGYDPICDIGLRLILRLRSRFQPLSKFSFKPIRCRLLSQGADMRRREFITLVGGAAVALPFGAHGQQKGLPVIGFLGTPTAAAWRSWVAAFVQRLGELGWTDGRTVAIEYRWAEGSNERAVEIAAEFVRRKVEVIVTSGTGVDAAKRATTVIPIIFAVAVNPVSSGFVASLARPGGNVTGLSIQSHDLAGKRFELLREVVPGFRRLAIMGNGGYPAAVEEMDHVQSIARGFGLEVVMSVIKTADDIAPAFEALTGRAEALYVVGESLVNANRVRIGNLALRARLPLISSFREVSAAGGLVSYGAHYEDLFRRAGDYVDKVLRGTKPADIPVEQPIKFETVFNLKTAKAFGIEIPSKLLFTADEVIE